MDKKRKQLILATIADDNGKYYYEGPIDGLWGKKSQAAAERFLKDFAGETVGSKETVSESDTVPEIPGNAVLVFSLAEDGNKKVSEHFTVREFACRDRSDPVFIHPILPVWAEAARTINGPFRPNSAYRTVVYNARKDVGGAKLSLHCRGLAMDIPKGKATPEELYDFFDGIMGNAGGLGIYDWGIHVDPRPIKSRWDERK